MIPTKVCFVVPRPVISSKDCKRALVKGNLIGLNYKVKNIRKLHNSKLYSYNVPNKFFSSINKPVVKLKGDIKKHEYIVRSGLMYYNSIIREEEAKRRISKFKHEDLTRIMNKKVLQKLSKRDYSYLEQFRKYPGLGSIVEIRDNDNYYNVLFGVVISQPSGKFSDNLTKIGVFTVDGQFKSCRINQIAFKMDSFYNKSWLTSIMQTEDQSQIQLLQTSLQFFIVISIRLMKLLRTQKFDDIAFAKISNPDSSKGVNIDRYINEIPVFSRIMPLFTEKSSTMNLIPENRVSIYMAIYLILSNNCSKYMMVKNLDTEKSDFEPNVNFLANSLYNSMIIHQVLKCESLSQTDIEDAFSQQHLDTFIDEVHEIVSKESVSPLNKFYRWLNDSVYMSQSERENIDTIINFLKFYLVYPHEKIHERVCDIFSRLESKGVRDFEVASNLAKQKVVKFLKSFGLLNDSKDIFLSNNIVTSRVIHDSDNESVSSISKLVTDSHFKSKSLKYSADYNISHDPQVLGDNFHYLRSTRVTPAFGLFAKQKDSELFSDIAISVDGENTDLTFNIHICDISSFIHPNSELFSYLIEKAAGVKLPNGKLSLMPESVVDHFSFKNDRTRKYPCLTFSLRYDLWRRRPFDLDSDVKLSLEYLDEVKVLSDDEVSNIITDRLFAFFKNRHSSLSRTEESSILYMFNLCKLRNKYRDNNGSLELDTGVKKPNLHVDDDGPAMSFVEEPSTFNTNEVRLFEHELRLFINELAAKYCLQKKVPSFHWHQEIIKELDDNSFDRADHVVIKPDTYLAPEYNAYDYQGLQFRKVKGKVPPSAYFCGLNYLSSPIVTFVPHKNTFDYKFGLRYGMVKQNGIFNDVEQLINQQQLVLSLHEEKKSGLKKDNLKFFLKASHQINTNGYEYKTPEKLKQLYFDFIEPQMILKDFLEDKVNRYWSLVFLESRMRLDSPIHVFKCVVTQGCEYSNLAMAYCLELGISVEISVSDGNSLTVGDQIICSNIEYLSPVEGKIVMSL